MLVVSGITGSLLVFGRESDAALNAHLFRVTPHAAPLNTPALEAVARNIKELHPRAIIGYIKLPRTPANSIEFHLTDGERSFVIYINPHTLDTLGTRDEEATWHDWLFKLHTELLSGETGEIVIGIGAIALFILSLSGVYLWFPGRKHFRRGFKINFRGNTKRTIYDSHNVLGFFASVFLLVSSVTGTYLVFHDSFARAVDVITGSQPRPVAPKQTARQDAANISFDDALIRARRALPQAEWTYILPAKKADAPLIVRGKLAKEWHPNGRTFVYLDMHTGEVLSIENALESPLGTRIVNMMYPLHIGLAGGIATRVLQIFIGLAPAVLFITGFLMWRNRTKPRRRVS